MNKVDTTAKQLCPIALTMGDPSGIGPEIIVKALAQNPELIDRLVLVGDLGVMQRAQAVCASSLPMVELDLNRPDDWCSLVPGVLRVVKTSTLSPLPSFGRVQASAGRAAARAIEWAAQAALKGRVSAVVTAPIHKEALHAAGYAYPGHTEMLQALAAQHLGVPVARVPVRMMLSNPELRTVLVSIHISLRLALEAVTQTNVLETIRIIQHHAKQAGWKRCRIAVAGLNPHAGEGGLMGQEERTIIEPAIVQARQAGLDVHGPFAPDTVFMRARRGEFDVVVAMYHDQGLIPVKYMGLSEGVNTTLGLPFLRTSPDHGTAFDLAGSGQADPASLLEAIAQARMGV
jgi:4-hydroxythreonine-4-phosphate dehydrogenase